MTEEVTFSGPILSATDQHHVVSSPHIDQHAPSQKIHGELLSQQLLISNKRSHQRAGPSSSDEELLQSYEQSNIFLPRSSIHQARSGEKSQRQLVQPQSKLRPVDDDDKEHTSYSCHGDLNELNSKTENVEGFGGQVPRTPIQKVTSNEGELIRSVHDKPFPRTVEVFGSDSNLSRDTEAPISSDFHATGLGISPITHSGKETSRKKLQSEPGLRTVNYSSKSPEGAQPQPQSLFSSHTIQAGSYRIQQQQQSWISKLLSPALPLGAGVANVSHDDSNEIAQPKTSSATNDKRSSYNRRELGLHDHGRIPPKSINMGVHVPVNDVNGRSSLRVSAAKQLQTNSIKSLSSIIDETQKELSIRKRISRAKQHSNLFNVQNAVSFHQAGSATSSSNNSAMANSKEKSTQVHLQSERSTGSSNNKAMANTSTGINPLFHLQPNRSATISSNNTAAIAYSSTNISSKVHLLEDRSNSSMNNATRMSAQVNSRSELDSSIAQTHHNSTLDVSQSRTEGIFLPKRIGGPTDHSGSQIAIDGVLVPLMLKNGDCGYVLAERMCIHLSGRVECTCVMGSTGTRTTTSNSNEYGADKVPSLASIEPCSTGGCMCHALQEARNQVCVCSDHRTV